MSVFGEEVMLGLVVVAEAGLGAEAGIKKKVKDSLNK